jgi:phosphoserine phosphatase RsbU/P
MNCLNLPPSPAPRTLIADDQPDVLAALRLLLKGEGYQTEAVSSPDAVLEALESRNFDLLLMDLNFARDTTSGQEGLDLLCRIQALDSTLPVVVMTGWGSIELAVESMRRGVRDFIQKPWENSRLLAILRTQIEQGRSLRKRQRLEAASKSLKEKEVEEAGKVQQGFMPGKIPQIRGYEIAGAWRPAGVVSGDYFDVMTFSNNQLALCVADAMGKGMPAALLMSNTQAAVKAFASGSLPPQKVCEQVNRIVCSNTSANKFITFFYCLLEAERRRLRYTNAGHNAPILIRRDGSSIRLTEGGAVLGVFPEWHFEQGEIELHSGDRVLLFTDGVTEARNQAAEEFGEGRLLGVLRQHRGLNAVTLQEQVMEAVAEFSGRHFQDDATLVVLSVE